MKNKINAEIIADSVNEYGNRITTFVLTYPRIIHAELLTHRLFSRNAASSRAIPALKMIKDIEEDPFIPVAFQKAHSGMQGTEYFEGPELEVLQNDWISSKDAAVSIAEAMNDFDCTKQLVNRILEPYQWYTCIVTATEYDNFFELRCPQYEYEGKTYNSWKDVVLSSYDTLEAVGLHNTKLIKRLKVNKGQGEIHISLLAEAMWDSLRESEPKQLKEGEWHIPFGDKMGVFKLLKMIEKEQPDYDPDVICEYSQFPPNWLPRKQELMVQIATARCARVSYLNFEGKDDYEADVKLYDRLKAMGHMSPFEHCARAMSEDEFYSHIMGVDDTPQMEHYNFEPKCNGWSGNFRGFVQLRKEIE